MRRNDIVSAEAPVVDESVEPLELCIRTHRPRKSPRGITLERPRDTEQPTAEPIVAELCTIELITDRP
jgi:hypothetical protein